MVVFPNCKINLGLTILDKRGDGYHNLQSIFIPVPLCDAIEIIEAENDELFFYGEKVEGDAINNSCIKALKILRGVRKFPTVHIHLLKKIPMGAGLGGGSSDGAFTLKLLNKKFNLELSNNELIEFALQIGSDCAFFIYDTPMYVEGRGEKLSFIETELKDYFVAIAYPEVHVDTATAYNLLIDFRKLNGLISASNLKEHFINAKLEEWKHVIFNDFENLVFSKYPEIQKWKSFFYDNGALFSLMSGSGSSVFGIFKKSSSTNNAGLLFKQYPNIFVKNFSFE